MKKTIRTILYFIEYLAFLVVYIFFRYIPFTSICAPIFGILAWKSGIRRTVVLDNLKRVFGHETIDEKLVKKIYLNAGFVLFDFFSIDKPISYTVENQQVLDEIKKTKSPVIGVSCHIGNWEIMPGVFLEHSIPITAVAKPMHNHFVNRFIEKKRLCKGMHIAYTRKKGMVRLLNALKKNHLIAFLLDQNAKKRGIPIPFFNSPASTFTGPAVLSLKWNLPVAFGYSIRNEDGSYRVVFDDLIFPEKTVSDCSENSQDVIKLLTLLNQKIEQVIIRHPEQWFWFHRRW